ncbi:MAG: hypothetical protein O7C67_19805 [Gammaproteobacteria bacterium]|nr:hypothetical protein [Gammaproteobacteria bacterium]
MKTILASLSLILVATAYAAEAPPASVGVSPSRIELDVNGTSVTDSAMVMNMTDDTVHLSASLVNWDLDENNDFRELPTETGSLPTAMLLNPVDFSIPPHATQTVRFAIMPERLHGQGEHRAMLFVSELVDSTDPGVRIRFRLGVPIYARVGTKTVSSDMHSVELRHENASLNLDLDISSTGTMQVRPSGYYLWWPKDSFPGEEIALKSVHRLKKDRSREVPEGATGGVIVTKPVFAGSRRVVRAKLQPPELSGEYVLALHLEAGDQVVQRTMRFEAAQPARVDVAQTAP